MDTRIYFVAVLYGGVDSPVRGDNDSPTGNA